MYTGTFTFVPADRLLYAPLRNPLHNCPANHQFEVNLVIWRLQISEIDITYDDTEHVMIGLIMTFVSFLHYKAFFDE